MMTIDDRGGLILHGCNGLRLGLGGGILAFARTCFLGLSLISLGLGPWKRDQTPFYLLPTYLLISKRVRGFNCGCLESPLI